MDLLGYDSSSDEDEPPKQQATGALSSLLAGYSEDEDEDEDEDDKATPRRQQQQTISNTPDDLLNKRRRLNNESPGDTLELGVPPTPQSITSCYLNPKGLDYLSTLQTSLLEKDGILPTSWMMMVHSSKSSKSTGASAAGDDKLKYSKLEARFKDVQGKGVEGLISKMKAETSFCNPANFANIVGEYKLDNLRSGESSNLLCTRPTSSCLESPEK